MSYFISNTQAIKKALSLALLLLLNVSLLAQNVAREANYKSQVLYMYQFSKLITWPAAYSKNDFIIGVIGQSDIVKELSAMASLKKTANGQRVVIRQFNSIEEIGKCHILYITSSRSRDLPTISQRLKNAPTLIIAEREGMAKKGAGINFVNTDSEYPGFNFNPSVLDRHQLKMSSELSSLGAAVAE